MWILLQFVLCALLVLSESLKREMFSGIPALSDEMINRINSMNTTWKAGRNFDPSEYEYVEHLLGAKLSEGRAMLPMKSVEMVEDIPDTFDSRIEWPDCESISLIRNQSNCGSCWAFGAVEAISDRICIASEGKIKVNISAEDLVACSDLGGCCGGGLIEAWIHWVNEGLVTGDLYGGGGCMPYSKPFDGSDRWPVTPVCNPKCQPGYPKSYTEDKHFGKSAYRIPPHVRAIQSEIVKNGPVEAAFLVYNDFGSYKSGVYIQHSQDYQAGHAIKLLGWGTENSTPYWLAANSWGAKWDDKGYFKILRGSNECGIEGRVVAGLPFL
ncbi:cathepsin B-like [Brevipalpus obovatus]|uniref:cathepsin B-like n=1 Tax=Brevipalpus obovatus TaxID=246614 RepID=UPI003D9F31B9